MEKINTYCKAKSVIDGSWVEGFPIYKPNDKVVIFNETGEFEVLPTTICRVSHHFINGVALFEHDIVVCSIGNAVVKYGEYNLADMVDTEYYVPTDIDTVGFYLEFTNGDTILIDYDTISHSEIYGNEFDENDEDEMSANEAIHHLVYSLHLKDSNMINARKKAIKALSMIAEIENPKEIAPEDIVNYTGKPVYILYGDEGEWDIVMAVVDNTVTLTRHSLDLNTYCTKWLAYKHELNTVLSE